MTASKAKKLSAPASESLQNLEIAANTIVQYLGDGKHEEADVYLDALVKKTRNVSCKALHHSLIHLCAQGNCPGAALWCALRMMRIGLKPNTVTFNTLLDASAKTGDINLATSLWGLMTDLGLVPNGITYNTMINTCVKGDDMLRAEWWLDRMRAEGIAPCPVSFNTVIAALAKSGEYERAEMWYTRMCEAGVKPDRVVHNSMMRARANMVSPHKQASRTPSDQSSDGGTTVGSTESCSTPTRARSVAFTKDIHSELPSADLTVDGTYIPQEISVHMLSYVENLQFESL